MKTTHLLIASALLLTACNKDDTNGADKDQPRYYSWGFYLVDNNTEQGLINNSQVPYHPDSLKSQYYNWGWHKLNTYPVANGGYASYFIEIPGVNATTPFPLDTIPAYLYLSSQDIDTLLIIRWRNKEFRPTEVQFKFFYKGELPEILDTLPGANEPLPSSSLARNFYLLLKK